MTRIELLLIVAVALVLLVTGGAISGMPGHLFEGETVPPIDCMLSPEDQPELQRRTYECVMESISGPYKSDANAFENCKEFMHSYMCWNRKTWPLTVKATDTR